MSLIIIIATIWGISALISHIKQARIAKEQMRQREAQARLLREQRAQAQAQREETARLIALEKARQAQDAWNAKQEAINRKHDEEICKLNQTVSRLSAKVEDINLRIVDLEAVKEMNYKKFLEADHAGDDTNKEKYLRKLISLDNQLSAARDSKRAALDKIENAQRKMSA